jgi:hypothetical protein
MKKIILISVMLMFVSLNYLVASKPIPAYNVKINSTTNFIERGGGNSGFTFTEGRRQVNVESSTTHTGPISGYTFVYVYKLDFSVVLGPFKLYPDNVLSVDIDEDKWGVLVQTDQDLSITIWISYDNNAQNIHNQNLDQVNRVPFMLAEMNSTAGMLVREDQYYNI